MCIRDRNLLNWGEEGVDYEIKDAENNIIGFPEGKDETNTCLLYTSKKLQILISLGFEAPH